MYKIIINTSQDGTILVKNCSQYSILKSSIIELHSGENILDDLKYGFYLEYRLLHSNDVISIDLSKFDTSNVTNMGGMFVCSPNLVELDLSSFDTSKVEYVHYMFAGCSSLVRLDLSNFDARSFQDYENMFVACDKLIHIKCKRAFKEWCLTNQDSINLPFAMRDGGNDIWDIID